MTITKPFDSPAPGEAVAYPTMNPDPQTTWIKRGLHRSVAIQETQDGQRRVVKRYRAQSWLRRCRDRARAENEFELLRALYGEGLRVPEPYELRHRLGGWEVHCELIDGARSLRDFLLTPGALPVAAEVVARSLGELLGQAHALGLDHGDLHAGNLLVDEQGQVWMIDFTHAAVRKTLPDTVIERDLVALAADSREFVKLSVRRRCLVAWNRARSNARSEVRTSCGDLAIRVEDLAVERRASQLIEHGDRWMRASGVCDVVEFEGGSALVSRTALESRDGLRERIDELRAMGPSDEPIALAGCERETWIDAQAHSVQRSWANLGRAAQHGLPGLEPLAMFAGEHPRALYLVPTGARPVGDAGGARDASFHALGHLHGALFDRGLQLASSEHLWRSTEGELLLGPGCVLMVGSQLRPALTAAARETYAAAFLSEWRGTDAGRAVLRTKLLDG